MNDPRFPLTIIGFGSQAKAWALNLLDSNSDVTIALKKDSLKKEHAKALGFKTIALESEELTPSKTLALLIPDDQHLNFLEKNVKYISPGAHLVYAHGFSLSKERLNEKYPQFHHSLLAPKAIASEVRYQYEIGGKIGAAYFAESSALEIELKKIASLVGFSALYPSRFEEETYADLMSEQSILCSLLPYVSLKSYNLLRANGISKEVAFMECFLELKSISQALVTLGPIEFFKLISPNALIGSQKGREILLGEHFDQGLNKLFEEIKNKKFYEEVNIDANKLRNKVIEEWKQEEMTEVFNKLKDELINK